MHGRPEQRTPVLPSSLHLHIFARYRELVQKQPAASPSRCAACFMQRSCVCCRSRYAWHVGVTGEIGGLPPGNTDHLLPLAEA